MTARSVTTAGETTPALAEADPSLVIQFTPQGRGENSAIVRRVSTLTGLPIGIVTALLADEWSYTEHTDGTRRWTNTGAKK